MVFFRDMTQRWIESERLMIGTHSNDNPISSVLHVKLSTNDRCVYVCPSWTILITRCDSREAESKMWWEQGYEWPRNLAANEAIHFHTLRDRASVSQCEWGKMVY